VSHSHSHSSSNEPPNKRAAVTRRRANILLTAILGPITLAAIIAMIALWPSGTSDVSVADPYATAPGVSFETGTISEAVSQPCADYVSHETDVTLNCLVTQTTPDSGGPAISVEIPPDISSEVDVREGDRIRYLDVGALGAESGSQYSFIDFIRTVPMGLLAALYAVVVIAVARWRGFRALLGLGGAYLVMAYFVLPGLVDGTSPLLLGLVGSIVIMIGVLYFAHGFSARTSTALLGTIFGLAITAALAAWATSGSQLTGLNDDTDHYLSSASNEISLSGILLCGLIISGLGVLNDVTVTQSSAVWEMHELAPSSSGRTLFSSAMRVGRDHIASTVYTIVFAYAGAALPLLLLTSLQGRPLLEAATTGELAEEIVRTLVGSVGLVLAIPVTTLIAVLVVKAVGSRPAANERADEPLDEVPRATSEAATAQMRPRTGLSSGDDW
jgi:uncharacterized membrane protein